MSKAPVPFRLVRVNTEEFATFPEIEIQEDCIELKTGVTYAIDDENKAVKCVIRILFECSEKAFIVLQSSCEFEIEPEAWSKWLNAKNTKLTIPKGFARHLAVLTLGTSRGILHSKTENTQFNQFLLPTTNVNELVKEDIKIDVD